MNKIYKLKFDTRRNELVVVSEITSGLGKTESTGQIAGSGYLPFRKLLGRLSPLSLFTGLVFGAFPLMALAVPDLPTGGQIVAGAGSISASGNQMNIHQNTRHMVANWNSFDIGKNHTVEFIQPNSSAVALNRVTGGHESQIMGTLRANGQVFLVNPNGVLFGKGSSVSTAGLVASTRNISNAAFMKGQYTFSDSGSSGTQGAQIINQGSLTTIKGGYIVLVANQVKNSGHISTPSGKTVLTAAQEVTLQLDSHGLTSVSVNGSVVNALVENSGLISAGDGSVWLTARGRDMLFKTVVNNTGTIEAKGLASRGGDIVLDGGESGVVSQRGQLLADSQSGQGGTITVEGQNIHLASGSRASATGKNGGGEVYIGGGWQGKDGHIRNAERVVMDKNAVIDVSAGDHGNGGKAVLWSEDYTSFQGRILAKGGTRLGEGGQVETSSHQNLQAFGDVDASATNGRGGQWLLDPADVTIVDGSANTSVDISGKGSDKGLDTDAAQIFSPSATGAQIGAQNIVTQLNNGTNVTVQTSGANVTGQSGNITVNAAIEKTSGADASLTLQADGNITVNKNISSTAGKLDIALLGAGSNTGMIKVANSSLSSNGGNITLDQLNHTVTDSGGATTTTPNALTINVNNSTLDAGSTDSARTAGNLTLNTYNPNVNLSQAQYVNTVRNGGSMLEVSGNSQLHGNNIVLQTLQDGKLSSGLPVFLNGATLTADNDLTISGVATNGSGAVNIEFRGTTNNLTATKGNITLINDVNTINLNGLTIGGGTWTAGGNVVMSTGLRIALTGTTVNAGGDITLLGGGTHGAILQVINSTLNSTGGNITLDQLNHTVTDSDGATTTNPNALTIKVSNSTLNASGAGNITLNTYNPNVNLSQAQYVDSVRNGGSMLEVSGNSQLHGNNIVLQTLLDGKLTSGLPVFLNGATLTADNDLTISGVATNGSGATNIEFRGTTNNLTATKGNITLSNSANKSGLKVGGGVWTAGQDITVNAASASGTGLDMTGVDLTAAHDINLSAQATGGQGILITNGSLSAASGNLTLNGSAASASGSALSVTGANLNATRANFTGSNSGGGTGFSLTNLTLSSALSDLANVTFSSAGSAASTINYLDSSVVTDTNRDTLLNRGMDNLTSIDMNGAAIFNNATAGWRHDYISTKVPYGWIFNNASLTAGGDVNLKGLRLTNSTITVANGSFSLSNDGESSLAGDTLNVSGAVNLSTGSTLTLTGTTVNAGSDITLLGGGTDSAMIQVVNSSLNSTGGNITLDQLNHTVTDSDGATTTNPNALTIKVSNSTLNASNTSTAGNITLNTYNPNVNLSQAQYVNTVRNGGSMLEVSGNSQLHGNNIVLQTLLDGKLTSGLPVFLNGATLTADNDLTISGVATNGSGATNIEFRGTTNNLTATKGNITLSNSANKSGLKVGGGVWTAGQDITVNAASASGTGLDMTGVDLTAAHDINLSAQATGGQGILITNGSLSAASGNLTLNGSAAKASGSGLYVKGTRLNATHANFTGSNSGGIGFSLTNLTLSSALSDLANVTFSSAGSGASAVNYLDKSVVTSTNYTTLLNRAMDNLTSIDLSGTAIFNDATAGWTHDYSSKDKPNGGWIFNNASVAAGGDVNLTGVGFSNSTIIVTNGSFSLSNNGSTTLTDDNLSVSGAVNVISGVGIDLTGTTVNAGSDITLLGGDAGIAILKMVNSTLNATGGNIVLNGNQAIVNNSNISGQNITAVLDNTFINGGLAWSQMNSSLNATKNITLSNNVTSGAAAQGATFTNTNLTAGENINLNFSTVFYDDYCIGSSGILLSGANVLAGNNITFLGYAKKGHIGSAITVNNNSTITTTNGVITLTGNAGHRGPGVGGVGASNQYQHGVDVSNALLTASNGSINIRGTGDAPNVIFGGYGLKMNNVTVNAGQADFVGMSSSGGGTGFYLSNLTWQGGLTDINNITLSSAGSVFNANNRLGVGVIDNSQLFALMNKGIENPTYVDKSQNDIIKGCLTVNTEGDITAILGNGDKQGSWVFDGIDLNASRDINLSGIGFTNSTLEAVGGLTLNNGFLSGSNVTAGRDITLQGSNAVLLSGSNVTAGRDITLQASNGSMIISSTNVTSTAGNITLISHNSVAGNVAAIDLNNSELTASEGGITMNGTTPGTHSGVRITKVNMTANASHGAIDIYGESSGKFDDTEEFGSVYFGPANKFSAKSISVDGRNNGLWGGSGIAFINSDNTFNGDVDVSGVGGKGVSFRNTNFHFNNGDVLIHGSVNKNGPGGDAYYGSGAIFFDGYSSYTSVKVNTILNNANLTISADSTNAKSTDSSGIGAFAAANSATGNMQPGMTFSGNGNVEIIGKANDGAGVDTRMFDNTNLNGNLNISGSSISGTGIYLNDRLNINLKDTNVTGTSVTGNGVYIATGNVSGSVVNFGNNTITGTSNASSGILINGNNVTITNGSLNGTSSGAGAGVALIGGTDYTIDGAVVSGQSEDGAGVSASGNLSANNNATLSGTATGSGTGVTVNGSLASDGGVTISGTATSGDGVQVSGDTLLSNATVTGTTDTGSGIHVGGNLTNSNTTLAGEASGQGAGVEIGGNISGGVVSGQSATGNGVLVSGDETTVSNATVTGNTTTGTGVTISGNLTNAGNTTVSGSAAGNGAGVELGGNVTGGSVSGNSDKGTGVIVTGGNSSATDTVLTGNTTTGTGVTISGNLTNAGNTTVSGSAAGNGAGVELGGNVTGGSVSGNSDKGTGVIVTGGNSSATDTVLTGNTTTGTGVTISGNLTNAGNTTVSGSAAGNGTGLSLNGTVNGSVSGTSGSGTGAHISDGANITTGSQVNGSSAQGNGTVVSGNITNNGSVAGNSTHGDGLVLNSTVTGGGALTGSSTNGAGAHITGDTHLDGGSLSGTTTNGSGIQLDGNLTHTDDSKVDISVQPGGDGQATTGCGTIQGVTPPDVTPPDITPPVDNAPLKQHVLSQQAAISQVPHARPLTQSAGYQAAPQPVDISLCTGEGPCRSLKVNQTLTATSSSGEAASIPEKAAP